MSKLVSIGPVVYQIQYDGFIKKFKPNIVALASALLVVQLCKAPTQSDQQFTRYTVLKIFRKKFFGAFCSQGQEEHLSKISAKSDQQLSRYKPSNTHIYGIATQRSDNGHTMREKRKRDRHILSEQKKKLITNRISDVNFVAFANNKKLRKNTI